MAKKKKKKERDGSKEVENAERDPLLDMIPVVDLTDPSLFLVDSDFDPDQPGYPGSIVVRHLEEIEERLDRIDSSQPTREAVSIDCKAFNLKPLEIKLLKVIEDNGAFSMNRGLTKGIMLHETVTTEGGLEKAWSKIRTKVNKKLGRQFVSTAGGKVGNFFTDGEFRLTALPEL